MIQAQTNYYLTKLFTVVMEEQLVYSQKDPGCSNLFFVPISNSISFSHCIDERDKLMIFVK